MKQKRSRLLPFLVIFMPIFLFSEKAASEVVFGMTGSLTGHFGFYGKTIRNAIIACFNRANENSSIHGKKLHLVSMDDYGDSNQTKKNIEEMHERHSIDMFLGVMGTRGILSIFPMIQDKKIAMLFPWGGHEQFRNPQISHIINGFGYMSSQIDAIVAHLREQHSLKHTAIFHADDSFSTQAANDLAKKLKNNGTQTIAIEQYNRFTMNLYPPADRLIATDPRTVICICTSMPAVKLINYFFEKGHYGTRFIGIDSTFLVPSILKTKGAPFTYTSTVPDPTVSSITLAKEYRNDLEKYFPDDEPSILSFAYYVAASIIVRAIQNIDDKITKERIIETIEQMKNEDLKGYFISFDASDRYAFGKQIWII